MQCSCDPTFLCVASERPVGNGFARSLHLHMKTSKSRGLPLTNSKNEVRSRQAPGRATGRGEAVLLGSGGCCCCCCCDADCSCYARLKYSMASRSQLGMQISNGESHVSAEGLIFYPTSCSFTPICYVPTSPAPFYTFSFSKGLEPWTRGFENNHLERI